MSRIVVGVFVAGLVGVIGQGPAQAAAATSSGTRAFVCGRGLDDPPCVARPAELEFSDNHDLVAGGMRWSRWGRPSTTARGKIRVNWTGTASTHRGVVRLFDLRPCHGQMAYRSGRVSWLDQSVIVRFDCGTMPAARSIAFRLPGDAIGCGMTWDPSHGSSARCDVAGARYTTPLAADCQNLDQGDSLVLGETVASTCHGDTVLRGGSVLPSGHSRRVGDIRCAGAGSGVTCRNEVTGHGFRMSVDSYRIW